MVEHQTLLQLQQGAGGLGTPSLIGYCIPNLLAAARLDTACSSIPIFIILRITGRWPKARTEHVLFTMLHESTIGMLVTC